MTYTIKQDIVVPNGYVNGNSGYVKPFRQVHLHSTGNVNSSVQNERDYLAGHYNSANYTHLVGVTNGKVDIRQVAHINQGAWDFGGDWNAEAYAAIELVEGSIKSKSDFKMAYDAYIWLARTLNKHAGNTDHTLDTNAVNGIKTHNYASKTGHGSDHVDPLPFLSKWGVSYEQLKKDIKNGIGGSTTKTSTPTKTTTAKSATKKTAIQQFKAAKNWFVVSKAFKVDKLVQSGGRWYIINYTLAGGKDATVAANGIPVEVLNNITRGNKAATKVGDQVKFFSTYNHGTIDKYDNASNGVGISFNGKMVWFDADAFIKL